MEKTGSIIDRINIATAFINDGRKNYTPKGYKSLMKGISLAMDAFKEAKLSADPSTIIQAEWLFLNQELRFCDESDKPTINSLNIAIISFNDAMRCLKTVESAELYRVAETTYPTSEKYRTQNLPKDAFHIACSAHRTRLQNTLRTPGMGMTEKTLYNQRTVNMPAAREFYMEKQRIALGLSGKKRRK